MKSLFIIFAMTAIVGCTGHVEIVGQGDVYSNPSSYNCSTEQSPCKYGTDKAVDEWFFAYPEAGNVFAGWENCPDPTSNTCHVKFSQETVDEWSGKTSPSLIALFAPDDAIKVKVKTCTVGPNMKWSAYCKPYMNRTFYIDYDERNAGYPDYEASFIKIIGFDNVLYTGGYAGLFKVDLGNANSDGLFVGGQNTPHTTIIKNSKTYPCQGVDGCVVTIGAKAL